MNIIALLAFTIVVGYVSAAIFRKTKIPDVIILLLFGLLLNYTGFVSAGPFHSIAPILVPLTLLIVLLDSGLGMELGNVLKSFSRSILLGVFGMLFCMLAATVVGVGLMGLDIKMSLLLGAIFGGTSSVTVLAILRGINIGDEVKSLLSLESVFNDSLCILVSVAILGLIVPAVGVGSPALGIISAYVAGIVIGCIYGLAWLIVLNKFRGIQLGYLPTLAAAMLVYVGSEQAFGAGTGAIAILFFGLMLGNAESFSRRMKKRYTLAPKIKEFHSEITFFIRAFFFIYLGLVASIQANYLIFGVALSIAFIVVRVFAVRLAMAHKIVMERELNVMKIMGTKGLVAAALVQLPVSYGLPGADVIQNIAFVVIFSTTLFAAVGVAVLSRVSDIDYD